MLLEGRSGAIEPFMSAMRACVCACACARPRIPSLPARVPGRDKPTLQRFVWNYLANLTALVPLTAAAAAAAPLCDPITNLCPAPAALACVGWRFGDNPAKHAATMGRCLNTTTRYTPSYSTRFFFGVRGRYIGWFAAPEQAAAFDARYGWPADPAWVESNWQYGIPKLRMKQLEARSVQVRCAAVAGGAAHCSAQLV